MNFDVMQTDPNPRCELHCLSFAGTEHLLAVLAGSLLFFVAEPVALQLRLYSGSCWHELQVQVSLVDCL